MRAASTADHRSPVKLAERTTSPPCECPDSPSSCVAPSPYLAKFQCAITAEWQENGVLPPRTWSPVGLEGLQIPAKASRLASSTLYRTRLPLVPRDVGDIGKGKVHAVWVAIALVLVVLAMMLATDVPSSGGQVAEAARSSHFLADNIGPLRPLRTARLRLT